MKQTANYIQLKGIEVPNFKEPKGERYHKAIHDIFIKLHNKREERGNAQRTKEKLENELRKINEEIIYTDEEEEKENLIKQLEEKSNEIIQVNALASLDLGRYRERLYKAYNIKELKAEATQEYLEKRKAAEHYMEALKRTVKAIEKEVNAFNADTESESNTRMANRRLMIVEGYK